MAKLFSDENFFLPEGQKVRSGHMSNRSFVDIAYDFYANYWGNARMDANEDTTKSERRNEKTYLIENGQGDCMYHAVYAQPEDSSDSAKEKTIRVYRDKLEALKAMKKYKGARLKTFGDREGAEEYALNGGEKPKVGPTQSAAEESSSNFKGPKPQELVAFRKLIEAGDLESVKNTVWENPRYLVSSGDTPAILQEGCRYNALHIVASKGQMNNPEMCELILNTVGNPDFVKLLYGEEDRASYVDRAQILVDLYLNTPDKGLNETPLHFASKYGLKDVVKVLVSYSQCVKTLRNKYNKTPAEVICTRKCQEAENLKREILMLLEEQYYVPVLRSDDNTLPPSIGVPFSPTSPPAQTFDMNPISPRIEVRAFAGPMTKPQAMEFRRKWKTPPRNRLNVSQRRDSSFNDSLDCSRSDLDLEMRLHDTEKGLERVGRNLAEEYHVSWTEYWPFLDAFADFRGEAGLGRLEKFLEGRFNEACLKEVASAPHPETAQAEAKKKNSPDPMRQLCLSLKNWNLGHEENDSNSDEDVFFTPPSSPLPSLSDVHQDSDCDDEMCLAAEGTRVFIEGSTPTKIDFSVFKAVPTDIKPEMYPYIYRWRHEMQLIMDNDDFNEIQTMLHDPGETEDIEILTLPLK